MKSSPAAARPSSDTLRAKATAVQSLPVTVSLLCRNRRLDARRVARPGQAHVQFVRVAVTAAAGADGTPGSGATVLRACRCVGGCPQVESAGSSRGGGGPARSSWETVTGILLVSAKRWGKHSATCAEARSR
jgi:hypothetical protein